MGRNSPHQTYLAFSEWHIWAKTQYATLRNKKKKPSTPNFFPQEKG
tara:strand:+ start:119 stop:256 length:138 start_codon:yes stop_codon:yes gene_type:complete